ncbi:DNA-binding XRE family transcriptional regulator [Halopolyspora algeriensis]|uniref:DNA-binding XRE family transcriptional regulator n=1 Tax=Halopolyspora algeriensis TaxID=1500506 RepID=A0A368VFG5_9ACTN|nr:helix-turn-helix transcriptional regulator [Halopolyspora algeriensis]RCW39963.1 DNA-binding XRE family transcriptional regulator [Halopolyspora algeriensis]TQM46600.1 DNA-binding XRE family transcriptional regulator [Halopolyspora algeriensis]
MDGANKVRQLGLGADLRTLREKSGMSTRSVAEKLGISRMAVNRTEAGTRNAALEEVIALCALYGVTGRQRERLIERARGGDGSSSWLATGPATADQVTSLIALEGEASVITDVSVTLVPGLVQTAQYMRAVMGGMPEAEWMVATRMARQALLTKPEAPSLRLIVDEFVLRRRVGGKAVMYEQLDHLLRVTTMPNVSVHIIPATAGMHAGLDGSFVLLNFPEREPHVYIEARRSGLVLTRARDVEPFAEGIDELDRCVLDDRRSSRLIEGIKEELAHE